MRMGTAELFLLAVGLSMDALAVALCKGLALGRLDLGRALQSALKVEGLTSEWLRRAVDAPATVDAATVDCVLLDLTMPDGSGFDLLARWRSQTGNGGQVPIIVITARSAVEDRLAGLDGGADDFVIKPFATAELLSRIRAVLRRSARQASERWVRATW